jgi:hypothetical protein
MIKELDGSAMRLKRDDLACVGGVARVPGFDSKENGELVNNVEQFNESWKALGGAELHRAIEQKHAAIQQMVAPVVMILVAHVTVGDETLIVKASEITAALIALNGEPKAGMRLDATIVFDAMAQAEFAAVSEYQ